MDLNYSNTAIIASHTYHGERRWRLLTFYQLPFLPCASVHTRPLQSKNTKSSELFKKLIFYSKSQRWNNTITVKLGSLTVHNKMLVNHYMDPGPPLTHIHNLTQTQRHQRAVLMCSNSPVLVINNVNSHLHFL